MIARGWKDELVNSAVWTENDSKVTAVRLDNQGQRVAFGSESGKVVVLSWKDGKFEQVWEAFMSQARITQLLWHPTDNNVVIAAGQAAGKLCAFNITNNKQIGDIGGYMAGALTMYVDPKTQTLFGAGESNEILVHTWPWKQGKKMEHPHTGYINSMRASPDGSKLAIVSADKTISVYNVED